MRPGGLDAYVNLYKQAVMEQSARTDSYFTTIALDAIHPHVVNHVLVTCSNEAQQAGLGPIACVDALGPRLQAVYQEQREFLVHEEKANNMLANFRSQIQGVQPGETQVGTAEEMSLQTRIEKRSAFLATLPEFVQYMQETYHDQVVIGSPVNGTSKERLLQFLLAELPQRVRDSCGQLYMDMRQVQTDLEQQMAATNLHHNQEKDSIRRQVKQECDGEVSRLQAEVIALKEAQQAQPRGPGAGQSIEPNAKRMKANNTPASAAARATDRAAGPAQTAQELPDSSQRKRKKAEPNSIGPGPSSANKEVPPKDRLAHEKVFPVKSYIDFGRMTIQEHKDCLIKLLPSQGKKMVKDMEGKLRIKAEWTKLLKQEYDALNPTDD